MSACAERRHRRDQDEAELHRRQHRRPTAPGQRPSIISSRSPRLAPSARRPLASRDGFAGELGEASASRRARRSPSARSSRPCSPAASSASNQSSAQLKLCGRGQRNGARAMIAVASSSSRSRASRKVGVRRRVGSARRRTWRNCKEGPVPLHRDSGSRRGLNGAFRLREDLTHFPFRPRRRAFLDLPVQPLITASTPEEVVLTIAQDVIDKPPHGPRRRSSPGDISRNR